MKPGRFSISDEVVVITGGAGLLGVRHAEAVAEIGGIPVIVDVDKENGLLAEERIREEYKVNARAFVADITNEAAIGGVRNKLKEIYRKEAYGLINNAAIDPKFDAEEGRVPKSRLEGFSLDQWNKELSVGLTGAFLCAKVFGSEMAKSKRGVILNISSDLGVIAPDQRLYSNSGLPEHLQKVKPVTYSVIKHGLIGLTKYVATYWGGQGVRCNAFAPGGVYNNHSEEFVERISKLIPMGRMADVDEYKGVIQFLISDASSYLNGATIVADGGRSIW